jgi:hypothetical protein
VKESTVTILGAVIWAAAFIASAAWFKGQSRGDWIEGALLVVWIVFVSCRAARGPRAGG